MKIAKAINDLKRKFSPNNSFWAEGVKTRSRSKKPKQAASSKTPVKRKSKPSKSHSFIQMDAPPQLIANNNVNPTVERGGNNPFEITEDLSSTENIDSLIGGATAQTLPGGAKAPLQRTTVQTSKSIPSLMIRATAQLSSRSATAPRDSSMAQVTDGATALNRQTENMTTEMDISDISDVDFQGYNTNLEEAHPPELLSNTRLSEHEDDNPSLVKEKLTAINQDLQTLKNLKFLTNGADFAETTFSCISRKLDDLNRHIVMNNMTEQFAKELQDMMLEALKAKNELKQYAPAQKHDTQPSRRRSRACSENSRLPSVFEDAEDESAAYQIRQRICQQDQEYRNEHLTEKIATISSSIEDDRASTVLKIKRADDKASEALTEARTANTMVKSAVKSNRKLEERMSKMEATVEALVKDLDKTIETNKKVEAKLSTLESALKRKVKEDIQREVVSIMESCRIQSKSEIDAAITAAKSDIRLELSSVKQLSNPQVDLSTLKTEIQQIQQMSIENKCKADALISSDRNTRIKISKLQDTVLRTSTPVSGNNTTSALTTEFHKKNLTKLIERIEHYCKPILSSATDIAEVRKRHAIDLPKLKKELEQLSKLITEYLKSDIIDDDFYKKCIGASDGAEEWIKNVEVLYDEKDIHTVDTEKGKHSQPVTTFTGDHKQTVYEFIEDFEAAYLTVGSSKTRAGILHKNCLSTWIQSQTNHLAQDYSALKNWLIDAHGDLITIVSKLMSPLETLKKPSPSAYKERLEFFTSIANTLMRLERTASLSDIPLTTVQSHLHSRLVLERLVSILPQADDVKLMENLRSNGMDTKKFQGWETYSVYKTYIQAQIDDMQRAVEKQNLATPSSNNKPKIKQTNKAKVTITAQSESESDDEAGFPKITLTAGKGYKQTPWWTNGLNFPCPMFGHDHELSTCEAFFALTPKERRAIPRTKKGKGRQICWSCLHPTAICKKECIKNTNITDVLKCQGCATYATENNLPCLSPLYCIEPDHDEIKPQPAHFLKELKRYFKGSLTNRITDKNITFTGFGNIVLKSTKDQQRTEWPESNTCPTAFDTRTGKLIQDPRTTDKVSEDPLFLMQWINIGDTECLILFDRGSNVNLIDGQLAEEENLKIMSDKSATIKVIGGEQVSTQYGVYELKLGSKETNNCFSLTCHGLNEVTEHFEEYNLFAINQEVRSSSTEIDPSEPLPTKVGGGPVKLLIGISDVALDPIKIGTLESGIGIYRSPFIDKFGSSICYAGPHSSITETNQKSNRASLCAMFTNNLRSNGNPLCVNATKTGRLVSYAMTDADGLALNPTPLTVRDFQDLNCKASDQEDLPDSCQLHFCTVLKARIPISKMRELIDQDDIEDNVSFRCPKCSECITCRKSQKQSAVSIQNAIDQQAVRDSVSIENNKVFVDTPFTKDPDKFLTNRHKGTDNKSQAMKVYRNQCRHSERLKEGMRKVHKDLVDQGFIKRLEELPKYQQEGIHSAPFKHFMPWRIVERQDSESTPVRMVVDPTMTGLNIILPKGENNLGRMNDILIRSRVGEHLWATDIKKMYNQLHLKPSSLRFQLMLYHEELNPDREPTIWVMTTAWYGMTPSGNQAGEAINLLKEMHKDEYPEAELPLSDHSRFVDDIVSIAETEKTAERQIRDVREVLSKGGFSLKFVVRSGQPPDAKASSDGKTVKMLGYRYDTMNDMLSPMFTELNLNKKVRGARKPNTTPITTPKEALSLLKETKLTRRIAMSKLAEFFDPIGIFEPKKLQLKLALSQLNSLAWDQPLSQELQEEWQVRLADLMELPTLRVIRNVIPKSHGDKPIRLLCLSDAGEQAGGAAVYAGVELTDGTYSCGLVAAKSKLMSGTVPRNELSAIMLMTELAFIVKRAIGERISEIIYITDSSIAMAWCLNTTIKLRLYVYNRVETIRRMISWTTNSERIPLFWVDGSENIADLITKPAEITTKSMMHGSEWQHGKDWMCKPTSELPVLPIESINIPQKQNEIIKQECFDEPFFMEHRDDIHPLIAETVETEKQTLAARGASAPPRVRTPFLVDLIKFGWFKGIRITSLLLKFKELSQHKIHLTKQSNSDNCLICKSPSRSALQKDLEARAEESIFKFESRTIMNNCKKADWQNYLFKNDTLWFIGRFAAENPLKFKDLDAIPFLDAAEITDPTPVVLADSDILFSYIMAIHTRLTPHAGVMITLKKLAMKMHIPSSAQAVIKKVRDDCTTCRLLLKKTVELEMQKHAYPRTMIAPPFYHAMVDIAYGFPGIPYKNARKRIPVYALVIVCILTGATNIIAMEGLETQDVILAIETHSSYYGVPAELFIDSGTQLKAIEHAKFSVRDIDSFVHDAMGLKMTVSTPKSHEERGRVERKIGLIRKMIEKAIDPSQAQTAVQWQALFAKVASALDDLPLAKGDTSNTSHLGFEILTANRLKLGRNNNRALAPRGITLEMSANLTRLLDRNREIYHTWFQIFLDNIHLLALKPNKWNSNSRKPKENDIVLFVLSDAGYTKNERAWKLGKVIETRNTKVKIMSFNKSSKNSKVQSSILERNVRDVSIILSADELYVNSRQYYEKHIKHA